MVQKFNLEDGSHTAALKAFEREERYIMLAFDALIWTVWTLKIWELAVHSMLLQPLCWRSHDLRGQTEKGIAQRAPKVIGICRNGHHGLYVCIDYGYFYASHGTNGSRPGHSNAQSTLS